MGILTRKKTARAEPRVRGERNPRAKIAVPGNRGIKVVRTITVRRPPAELYAFWRELPNLMKVVKHPVIITGISRDESHWSVSASRNRRVEWDALIINDRPGELIAWRSREGADVENAGTVRFEPAPADKGTAVTVALGYNPPGGKIGALMARLTGDFAGRQVAEMLRRFKTLMEAGETPTSQRRARS